MNQNFIDRVQRSEQIEREFEKRARRAQACLTLLQWLIVAGVALAAALQGFLIVYLLWKALP